eukprot:scaffold97936_cov21-Tisochrysis_lutea.AAC.1
MPDGQTAIVRGMFKKETDPSIYTNLKVQYACAHAEWDLLWSACLKFKHAKIDVKIGSIMMRRW